MKHERLVLLLRSHRARISRALVRQMRILAPRYATVEPNALEENIARFLGTLERFLSSGDQASLRTQTEYTAQLRFALGFRISDFMLAALSFLPVLRRFLIENAPNLAAGMADYEALEAVAIPTLADAAALFHAAEEEDEVTSPSMPRAQILSTWSIESVTGGTEDESVPWRL